MGTLTLDSSISEIISQLYDKEIARTWANDAADDERTDQYRLFTLKQSLLTGVILGVIEEKMQDEMMHGKKGLDAINKLTVTILKTGDDCFKLEPVRPRDIFASGADGIRMTSCKVQWLRELFQWYGTSFESDFDAKGADRLGGLLMAENSIFDNIGFGIPENILNGLKELSSKLKERVKIELED